MTVGQLIMKLLNQPQDLTCVIYDPDSQQYGHVSVIESVTIGVVRPEGTNILRMENFRPDDHTEKREAIRIN